MAEFQERNDASGIKLFGATILVKERSQVNDHNQEPKKVADQASVEKRPDKIIACPRCKSMETKFCYFNNYNVNQPRHFCKGCQRYWTAGGALRNVPVGAGRRKAKPPCQPGLSELSRVAFLDGSGGLQQLEFDEWQVAGYGGFQHLFQAKRRRSCASSTSQ